MNDPPDEPKTTKADEPVEFELQLKIVKDDRKKLHWTSWINRERISSHTNKKSWLTEDVLTVSSMNAIRFDVYNDRALKGKVVQNISNKKIFQ